MPPPAKTHISTNEFAEAKADYKMDLDAANPNNRFMRRRTGFGFFPGQQPFSEYTLHRVRETARHMAMNDSLPGQATERLVDQVLPGLFRLEPQTGEKELDDELRQRFLEWGGEKDLVDHKSENDLLGILRRCLEQTVIDGEIFPVFTEDGSIQCLEADYCMSPNGGDKEKIALGVEFGTHNGRSGVPVAYHFAKTPKGAPGNQATKETEGLKIWDNSGIQVVAHLYNARRMALCRGYSWYAPVMVDAGMLDDLDFAMVLKAQSAATIAGVIETTSGGANTPVSLGNQESVQNADGTSDLLTKIKGGALINLPVGKKLSSFTAPVPNNEHMAHVKYQMQKIGAALHLPYILLMLDASETNFSGWRGAMDAARVSYQRIQDMLISQFLRPVYRWQIYRNLPSLGRTAVSLFEKGRLLKHKWIRPGWKYIQPLEDAKADSTILENRLNSPSGLLAQRGLDFDDVAEETIRDNGEVIRLAMEKAEELNKEHPEANIDWREIARWQLGIGITAQKNLDENGAEEKQPEKSK